MSTRPVVSPVVQLVCVADRDGKPVDLGFDPRPYVTAETIQAYLDDCKTVRARREAPLVALVNACPEGLDPNGWRAMILMLWECWKDPTGTTKKNSTEDFERWTRESKGEWTGGVLPEAIRLIRTNAAIREPLRWITEEAALTYRRALSPAAKVAPERKVRGPVIVCDAGWED